MNSDQPSPVAAPVRRNLQVLCVALMSSLIVVLVAVSAALSSDGVGQTPLWAFAVLLVLGVVEVMLLGAFGYRTAAIPAGTPEADARKASLAALQATTIIRFVIAEAIALVSVALAFLVDEGGLYLVFVGVAIAELLMVLHVWPSERVVGRIQQSLERDGGRSYLREALDSPPGS